MTVLLNLAGNPENHNEFKKSGALKIIVDYLSSTNTELQVRACGSISNLSVTGMKKWKQLNVPRGTS